MKIREIRITPNDDGTYQITCCGGGMMGGKDISYSAKDLGSVEAKIKEAESEFAGMKSDNNKNDMKEFLGVKVAKSEDEDEDE